MTDSEDKTTTTLTLKQEAFCVHYTTIGAETFSNGTKSAIAAGYSEKSAHVQACAMLKKPKIRQRMTELHSENMGRNQITTDKVLADLEHDKLLARKASQYGVAKSCTELQGKYLAMFTDRNVIEQSEQRKAYDEREAQEAMRLSNIMLEHRKRYGDDVNHPFSIHDLEAEE